MTVTRRTSAPALVLLLALAAGRVAAESCPTERPFLSGPSVVQAGRSYSVAWTNVLPQAGPDDYYFLQRSTDPAFTKTLDQFATTRAAQTLPPAHTTAGTVYHRVLVQASSCPGASPGILVSNTLAVKLTADCDTPPGITNLAISPTDPPAFTTYVLTWDPVAGSPSQQGGATAFSYRLRRTSPYDVRESVSTFGKASFADPPGTYVYEVRAEATCGTVGPWSAPLTVRVGSRPIAALAVVQEPATIAAVAPAAAQSTRFAVRNTGTVPLTIDVRSSHAALSVSPERLELAPNDTQAITVRHAGLGEGAFHASVELTSADALLSIPIDVAIAGTAPSLPVSWSATDVDISPDGHGVLLTITNPGPQPATIVGSTNQAWLLLESLDSASWERPLAPGETRNVRLRVDRTRRRATTGTEVAAVKLVTAGFPDQPQVVQVVDDGPPLYALPGTRPDPTGMLTRLLYASLPNAPDARQVGRFGSDLWLANLDPTSPIDVSLYLTPLFTDANDLTYTFKTSLQPGETRRYRNIVAKVLGQDGACELEVRSPAPTLTANALINNTPLASSAPTSPLRPMGTTTSTGGQYGFEMRPTRPGEGVNVNDETFVVSGIFYNESRRTSLLFTETSNAETGIYVTLHDSLGKIVLVNDPDNPGKKIEQLTVKVPALGTVQRDLEKLLDPNASFAQALYAVVEFWHGTTDAFGFQHGSVVPLATVIDQVTQDASLRVGASTAQLDPAPLSGGGSASGERQTLGVPGSLPFGGGPAPLFFPAAHAIGAPLGAGSVPYWRTRVTFTNLNAAENRIVVLHLYGSDGKQYESKFGLTPLATVTVDDIIGNPFGFGIPESVGIYGAVQYDVSSESGSTWKDVDVQTETYTLDPNPSGDRRGQFATGMEGFSYRHGYSSYQSNLGTVQIDGAETSSRYRTNLVLEEVGGATCTVAISVYPKGSFVPIGSISVSIPPFGYVSKELFHDWMGLDLSELTDVRVVVRQIDGDGVYMAFASRISLATGDPANVFLRPALAGTGR